MIQSKEKFSVMVWKSIFTHIHHCDKVGDISHFSFKSAEYFTKNIDILAFEGISIHNSDADIKMNSRSEFHQPAVPRVALTIEVQERDTCRTIFNLFSLYKIPNHHHPNYPHSQSKFYQMTR